MEYIIDVFVKYGATPVFLLFVVALYIDNRRTMRELVGKYDGLLREAVSALALIERELHDKEEAESEHGTAVHRSPGSCDKEPGQKSQGEEGS